MTIHVTVPWVPIICPGTNTYLVVRHIKRDADGLILSDGDSIEEKIRFCGLTPVPDAVGIGLELYFPEGDLVLVKARFKLVRLHQLRAFVKMPTINVMADGGSPGRFRVHPDTDIHVPASTSNLRSGHIHTCVTPPEGYRLVSHSITSWYELRHHGLKPSASFWNGVWAESDHGQAHSTSFCGVEFEADFHSSNAKGIALQALLGYDYRSFLRTAQHRLHIESDSSLGSHGFEAVTMPHSIGNGTTSAHPGTYKFLTDVMGRLGRYGAHNNQKLCGMHIHLSRTTGACLRSVAPGRILDRLAASYVQYATRVDILGLTGRMEVSSFARPFCSMFDNVTSNPGGSRYRHINWANAATVEFRFPGPFGFADPTWACKMVDMVRALVMTADLLYSKDRGGLLSVAGMKFIEFAETSQTSSRIIEVKYQDYAMYALGNVIQKQEHLFPYAAMLMKSNCAWPGLMQAKQVAAATPPPAATPPVVPYYSLV